MNPWIALAIAVTFWFSSISIPTWFWSTTPLRIVWVIWFGFGWLKAMHLIGNLPNGFLIRKPVEKKVE